MRPLLLAVTLWLGSPGGEGIYVKVWDALGPFPIGKTEIDADPIAACCGGIESLPRADPSAEFFSELGEHGLVRWTRVQSQRGGMAQVHFPHVNWNQLLQWMDNQMVLETQTHLVGDLKVTEEGMYLVHARSVHSYVLDGRLYHGDIYSTADPSDPSSGVSTPLYLSAGMAVVSLFYRGAEMNCVNEIVAPCLIWLLVARQTHSLHPLSLQSSSRFLVPCATD